MNNEKFILKFFLISLPMTGVFCLNEKIRLPLILGIILFLVGFKNIKFYIEDVFFIFFISILSMTMIINNDVEKSPIFYVFGFIASYLFYYKMFQTYYNKYRETIIKFIFYASIILYIFVIYEFITRNFFPKLFFDLPRVYMITYGSTFLGKYIRARGFMEESGHTALFIEFCIPICIYYVNKLDNKILKILYYILFIISVAFINSAANIILLAASTMIIFIYNNFTHNNLKFHISKLIKFILLLLTLETLIVLILLCFPEVQQGIWQLIMKGLYVNKDISILDRNYRLNTALNILKNNFIFGIGPFNLKNVTNIDSSLNLFLDIWVFGGTFCLIAFLLYIGFIFNKLLNIKSGLKVYLFCSFFMIIIHHQIVHNFWYPWMWIMFSIITCEYKYSSSYEQLKNSNVIK